MTTRWEIRVDEANPEEEIPLTENGRIVLERRYLRKGPDGRPVETIPQMFRRVARAIAEAEKELGGDPALWEERFYQLLTSLRFLPNSPTFTGAGTPLGQLAACFTPEMRVITEHGLKRIADLQPGDRVLTHRGRYQPVLQTSRRFYRGPLRIIKVRRIGQRIEATPEHPFLTPRGWVMAADLRPGDRVAIGFPKGILPTPSFDLAETLSGEDLEVQSTPTTYVTPNAREAAQIIMPPLRSRRLIEKAFGIHLPDAGVSNNGVLRDEEHVYFEIENINEIYYEGYVYNCEVEEDHTYVVEGVVVHNCFVLPLEDDMGKIPGGIFQTLRDAALIQQTGGGNGFSFSRLRPKNAIVFSSMGRATGPVGFLRVYDRAFGEIAQGGSRRGANMAVLRVDHPDIEEFITCKTDENAITNFNISVGITDAFMRAVENDEEWELRFPDVLHPAYRNFRGTLEDAERAGIPIRVYKRVRARDLFRKIATQAHHNGEPGVLFLDTANRSNPVPHLYTLEATNPCGEQWLGPYENCCLGSVNLARHVKYVNGKAEVDWEKLRETVEWATRFLDNVVQVNQYVPAVPQLKEAAFKTRRIGLGFMGLADLMYHLRIRYGSEEGQEFAAQIAEFIRYHAMRTSIELARERGPFPAIRGSIYDPEDLKWEPPKPLKPYTRDWGRPPLDWNAIVEGIRRHGIRNAAQTTVAPTGCLVAGTMIITDRGLLPIEALGDPNGPQWQDVDWVVASEGGPRRATKFYVNGVAHTLRLVTRRGYVLQGTDGHRVRVWENGKWVWRRLDELKPGMRIPIVAGMIGTPQRVELDIPANKDPRCTDVRFPSHITPELAYLVGFFMGDGSLKQRSMRLSVSDPELKEELVRRIREVFGVEPRLLQDPRSRRLWSVEIHSKLLVEFWRKNGFNKIPARPGHRGKGYQPHVPIKILQTNDPRIYGAFLAGLLDADGMIQRGHLISWSTTCREFHDQVKAMLLALGVLTTSDVQQTGISGAPLYRLRTAHAEATRRLVQQLELLLRLRVPGSNGHVRRSYLRDTIPLSDWEKNSLLAIAGSTREQMRVWGWRQRGLANRETAIAFVQTHRGDLLHAGLESFVQAVEQPVFYDEIVAIEDGGWRETYDLSVPGTHAYIANGFVSHNTISTVAGCEGYGCEPVFALAYIRYVHEAEGRLELRYVSPLFMRALKEAGLDEETRARIIEEVLRKGTCQHIQELPDWIRHTFVVAQDLTPEEHVWMQASIQAFIDNSISKTINFPETATVEDVEKAYLLAWKLGCKGLTVYVAGSRQKEVLETLETKARKEQKEAAMVPAQPTLPQPVGPTVRPRPQKLAGVTYRIATPVGTAFITLNENGEGQPFEVFLNVGKAGSDIAAVAEAIGRLISLLLRLPSPVPPAERLRQVVDQLQGIGGGRALGFGPERVRSLPDGIARVLAEYLAERGLELPAAPAPAVQPALPLSEPHPGREEPRAMGPVGDICPQCGEATLLEQEGCRTCYNCGYSEC
jgi:adenosylcobalamin-dependent ribonucleoside-diphosphate reductase